MVWSRTARVGLTAFAVVAAAPAAASQVQTSASITISEPASVQMVNDAPLQALLGSGILSGNGITVTANGTGITGVTGLVGGDGASLSSASLTGTTINGEALSVSVGGSLGDVPANGNTGGAPGVSVVIAQYN